MIPLYIYFGEVFSLILSHFLEKVHACMAYRLSHFGDVFFVLQFIYIGCPKQWFFGWYWCNWSMICFLNNCPHRKVHQKKLGYCRTFCVKVHVVFSKESPLKRPKKEVR